MIKVLEVIRQGQIGGGESHLLDLIYFLDKTKITAICLSFTDGEMIKRLRKMGIKCYIIDTNKPFDIRIQKEIIKIINEERIQIVHAHGSRAASNVLFPVRKLHIPFIYTVHGWSFHDDQNVIIKNLRAWTEKIICHYANKVICVSSSNKETGEKIFGLKEAMVIENGVNLEIFNPNHQHEDLRETMGFSSKDFIIGFIARCTKQKNPIVFLDALNKAHSIEPSIKGLFVGEGEMDSEVNEYINTHKMEQFLFKSKFRSDVPNLLHTIDAYCLPSLWEGLSIALLEAMAMKKAIIATPTDGTCELINDKENGIIVPFHSVDKLVDAFTTLAKSTSTCKLYGNAAHEVVEKRFNAKRVADTVTQIYEEVYKELPNSNIS